MRPAFTLIEVLVVVATIAILIALLSPALARARQTVRAITCRSRLAGLMTAVHMYAADNADAVVPSYNMRGLTGYPANPLDGWGPILDKGRYLVGTREFRGNPFVCPDAGNVAGMAAGATGTDPENPKGYMDWPAVVTIAGDYATTIPVSGFDRIMRVAYWINGDNPIGLPRIISQGIHFTGSVGYGPDPLGRFLRQNHFADFRRPSQLIALADGLYSGQQQSTRLRDRDSRIGYRHPGTLGRSNLAFADGHVSDIESNRFPRKLADDLDPAQVRDENLGPNPTVYSDPQRYLLP